MLASAIEEELIIQQTSASLDKPYVHGRVCGVNSEGEPISRLITR